MNQRGRCERFVFLEINDVTIPVIIVGMICFLSVILIPVILRIIFDTRPEITSLLAVPCSAIYIVGFFSAISVAILFFNRAIFLLIVAYTTRKYKYFCVYAKSLSVNKENVAFFERIYG